MSSGLEDFYIIRDGKRLRFGYTTGSCAAAAAQAAARMLFSRELISEVRLSTPKGIELMLEVLEPSFDSISASCAIRKDAGDDPDVTNGMLIHASVRRCSRADAAVLQSVYTDLREPAAETEAVIGIRGGEGIGIVTLPGLEQRVGAPAINHVPREMIAREVGTVCREAGYSGGMEVTIFAPGGEKTAQKTFNPRLGIVGGISILGTSGIVEPMSERALVSAIEVELAQKLSDGRKYLLVTPGNYGLQYLRDSFPFPAKEALKCSNYVGQIIDLAVNREAAGMLFVAHIGKFVKVAGGIMNTHSREADCRMEILASCALRAGAPSALAGAILDAATTDEGLRLLKEQGLLGASMRIMMEKIDLHLAHRVQGRMQCGAIVFSNVFGELGRTAQAESLLEQLILEAGC